MNRSYNTQSSSTSHLSFLHVYENPRAWLFTLDHKRIGLMYVGCASLFFLVSLLLGVFLHVDSVATHAVWMDATMYKKAFHAYGTCMLFVVGLPVAFSGLGNLLLPLQIGSRSVAFPRLNLLSFYLFLSGGTILLSLASKGLLDIRWSIFTYTQALTRTSQWTVLGMSLLGASGLCTALNFIVTIHTLRASGLHWKRLPVTTWSLYIASYVQLLCTLPLFVLMALVLTQGSFAGVLLAATYSHTLLVQHLFWAYSSPLLCVVLLPALGVISELISVHSQRPLSGRRSLISAFFALALLSLLSYGRPLLTQGSSLFTSMLFSFFSLCMLIPFVFLLLHWGLTILSNRTRWTAPLSFVCASIGLLSLSFIGHLFLSLPPTQAFLESSTFSWATYHLFGAGLLFAFLGAGLHWYPLFTRKSIASRIGQGSSIALFLSVLMLSLPKAWMGLHGVTQGRLLQMDLSSAIHTALPWIQTSVYIGLFLGLAGLFVLCLGIWKARSLAQTDARNLWKATTLEWQTSEPLSIRNFESIPQVTHAPYIYTT